MKSRAMSERKSKQMKMRLVTEKAKRKIMKKIAPHDVTDGPRSRGKKVDDGKEVDSQLHAMGHLRRVEQSRFIFLRFSFIQSQTNVKLYQLI